MPQTIMIPLKVNSEGCFYHSDLIPTKVVLSQKIVNYSFVHHIYVVTIPKQMRHQKLSEIVPCLCAAFHRETRYTQTDVHDAFRINRSTISVIISTWLYS